MMLRRKEKEKKGVWASTLSKAGSTEMCARGTNEHSPQSGRDRDKRGS